MMWSRKVIRTASEAWVSFVAITLSNFVGEGERWQSKYDEVKAFIEANHRNPSKYAPEEKQMVHFLKRGRKQMNAGEWHSHPKFV